jgi:flagella basal body P-ring formation protein FlgA
MEQRDISSLVNGFITTPDKYHNFLVKRPIRMGQILTPHMLQVPKMVLRGERVTLLAEAGSLQVRSAGVALEDGIRGEVVRIRNSHSNRVIEGRVIAAGMVQITL